jgi:type 1 glutamine amidotransferase
LTAPARILSGGIFHPFDETSAMIASLLAQHGIAARVDTDIEQGVAALRGMTDPGLLIVNALRWRMQGEKYDEYRDEWAFSLSEAGRETIRAHVAGGGGLLVLHTGSICFDDWQEWGEVVGGAWVWGESFHPPAGAVAVEVTNKDHPITRGCADFTLEDDEVYSDLAIRPDVTPLLSASNGEALQCIAWAKESGPSRVVYNALGHGEKTLSHDTHRRILARSALWCLHRSGVEIEGA